MTVGISDCDGQLVNAGTGTPEGAVDIGAFAELLKQPPGQRSTGTLIFFRASTRSVLMPFTLGMGDPSPTYRPL